MADTEARSALSNGLRTVVFLSGPDFTCFLSGLMRSVMARYWVQLDTQHIRLKRIDPAMYFSVPRGIPHPRASLTHRLCLGVDFKRRYLHLMGLADFLNCSVCDITEAIKHQIVVCHVQVCIRLMLAAALRCFHSLRTYC